MTKRNRDKRNIMKIELIKKQYYENKYYEYNCGHAPARVEPSSDQNETRHERNVFSRPARP